MLVYDVLGWGKDYSLKCYAVFAKREVWCVRYGAGLGWDVTCHDACMK